MFIFNATMNLLHEKSLLIYSKILPLPKFDKKFICFKFIFVGIFNQKLRYKWSIFD